MLAEGYSTLYVIMLGMMGYRLKTENILAILIGMSLNASSLARERSASPLVDVCFDCFGCFFIFNV